MPFAITARECRVLIGPLGPAFIPQMPYFINTCNHGLGIVTLILRLLSWALNFSLFVRCPRSSAVSCAPRGRNGNGSNFHITTSVVCLCVCVCVQSK